MVVASRGGSPGLDALAGPRLVQIPADLTEPDAPARVVARAVEEFGGVDILVDNAGGRPPGIRLPRFSFHTPTDADWLAMFESNLFWGGGAIVNVSSSSARRPDAMNIDHSAAKAALDTVVKSPS